MSARRCAAVAALLTAVGAGARARVWYVNPTAAAPQNGSSFSHGYPRVQTALTAAAAGDEVWVKQGTYEEQIAIGNGVGLYGGFAGTETARTQANPAANPTILDGEIGPGCVVYLPMNARTVALDGFTVENGTGASLGSGVYRGGGLYAAQGTQITITRCIFKDNISRTTNGTLGGAICLDGIDYPSTINDNTFSDNTGGEGGGIAANSDGLGSLQRNVFLRNHAPDNFGGGGVYLNVSGYTIPIIANNTFTNNTAAYGGGMTLLGAIFGNPTTATVMNNTFTGNTAVHSGGGLADLNADTVSGNTFSGNSAADGGGISCGGGQCTGNMITGNTGGGASCGSETFEGNAVTGNTGYGVGSSECVCTGNVIAGNTGDGVDDSAGKDGSSLYANNFIANNGGAGFAGSGSAIINNSIAGNGGAGVAYTTQACTIQNNILAFNNVGVSVGSGSAGTLVISNNDVFGNTAAKFQGIPDYTGFNGNISADPALANLAANDLHILSASLCVDAGSDSAAQNNGITTDFDGQARIIGAHADIGADELTQVLVFTAQPQNGLAGRSLNPHPAVAIQDGAGHTLAALANPVTLAITPGSGPFGATLSGTATVNAVNGVATFNLSISAPGTGYRLTASSPGFTSKTSNAFNVGLSRAYVKTTGSDAKDGSTWANAKKTVTAGANITGPGGQTWVAKGAYTENLDIPDGVTLFGGFLGTETSLSQRDFRANATTIHAAAAGPVVSLVSGSANGVDGFTLSGGTGQPAKGGMVGGGYNEGGGVYVDADDALIQNNVITGNTATYGGGVAVVSSAPIIRYNTIHDNAVAASSPVTGRGGGLYLTATTAGAVVADNIVYANRALGTGSYGGALAVVNASPAISGNTFVGNASTTGQGDIVPGSGSPVFSNNIIANNAGIAASSGAVFSHNDYVPGNVVTNPLPDPTGTNGNVGIAPTFVDAAGHDYHLPNNSPLINIGDNAAVQSRETDIDGDARIIAGVVDIGADEVAAPHITLSDALAALRIAGGLQAAATADTARLDTETPAGVDLLDALRLLRKAVGTDLNP